MERERDLNLKKREEMFEKEIDEIRDKLTRLERDELLDNENINKIQEQLTGLWYDLPRILYEKRLKKVI